MSYSLKPIESGRIIFRQVKKAKGLTFFMCLLGFLFIVAGALNIDGNPFQIFGMEIYQSENRGLVLLGLISIIAGIFSPLAYFRQKPDCICFDNNRGAIEVSNKKNKFLLSYSEVEKVDLRIITKTSSKGGKSYEYMIFFSKKDGSVWDLFSGKKEVMKKNLKTILEHLDLKVPMQEAQKTQLPKGISENDSGITWKNGQSIFNLASYLAFICVLGIFILIAGAIYSNWDSDDIDLYVVLGIFFMIYLYLFVMLIRISIKNLTTTCALKLFMKGVEYSETNNSGKIKLRQFIPTEELEAVSFHNKSVRAKFIITILSVKDKEQYTDEQMKDILLGDFSFMKSPFKNSINFDVNFLDAVEKLQLEDYIQCAVKSITGKKLS